MPPLSNHLKATLASGRVPVGTWVLAIRTPAVVRMLAAAGLDFVFIDLQHSSFSLETVGDMCEMARASGITPIVRPSSLEPELTSRILDAGAMGVLYPDVVSREEVDRGRSGALYPPAGRRGSTSMGAPVDYQAGAGEALKRHVDANTFFGIQIESRRGIDNLDAILAGGGVDLVEVGRGDLSTDLGVPLETRHPAVLAALDEVIAGCRRHRVPVGVNCASAEDARDLLARGVGCISYSTDRHVLLHAYRDAVEMVREAAGPER